MPPAPRKEESESPLLPGDSPLSPEELRVPLPPVGKSPKSPTSSGGKTRQEVLRSIDKSKLNTKPATKGQSYKVDELKTFARQLGLPATGRKEELVKRIRGKLQSEGMM
jgi:hypothetical protein